MAVTGRDLITAALSRAGILAVGEALNADDLTVSLVSLNQMLDEWTLERLMVYGTYVDTLTMIPNVAAYSSSQLVSGQRPANKPLAVSVRLPGGATTIDYPVEVIGEKVYQDINLKSVPGIPSRVWVNMTEPHMAFTFWPAPYAAFTARFSVWGYLGGGVLTLDTSLTLPPGYQALITDNLAVRLATDFGKEINSKIEASAMRLVAKVKRSNTESREMQTELPGASQYRYDIYGDR
jgi:hypothetical protein